jgi:hypothetical protein
MRENQVFPTAKEIKRYYNLSNQLIENIKRIRSEKLVLVTEARDKFLAQCGCKTVDEWFVANGCDIRSRYDPHNGEYWVKAPDLNP